MKRRYLGDAKDAFKWDYHDHLMRALGYAELEVVLTQLPRQVDTSKVEFLTTCVAYKLGR